ncbi:MAG TPA: FAD-containing oxidoreductase [Candidatus Binatia bacterium]|nr:FAD-containing oxidoreductase [Candidatus Binatia bacterium]
MTIHYDTVIIGAGQAGPALAVRLAGTGKKVAIIERKQFGGTCVNTGCIPTKTLIASARVAHMARRAMEYGVRIGNSITVDMKRVKERKDGVVRSSNEGLEKWLRGTENLTVYKGHARFEGARQLRIADQLIEAEQIFINAGARANVPQLRGIDQVHYLTNSSMMDVDYLPEHLIIVGGSYVGLEFAQMFRRFGSEVTIVEMGPRLIHREDEDVSEAITEILQNESIHIRLNAECIALEKQGNKVAVDLDCSTGDKKVIGSHLLLAVGRVPNTDDLGLEKAGVVLDQRGYVQVDDQLRTNIPGIYALGECNGRGAFTHTSYNDYEIVAANLLDGDRRRVTDRIDAYALYTDPPLGRAGMTEAQVRKSGRKALLATRPMTRVGRAVEKGETQGFMKILVDADTKEILGASLLGIECDEVIHSILDVMYARAPYTVIQRAVHIHPTITELIPTMLGDLKPLDPT